MTGNDIRQLRKFALYVAIAPLFHQSLSTQFL